MEECRFYNQAIKMALKVEFLTSREELFYMQMLSILLLCGVGR
jgi:hypothetical protein